MLDWKVGPQGPYPHFATFFVILYSATTLQTVAAAPDHQAHATQPHSDRHILNTLEKQKIQHAHNSYSMRILSP